jgi:hypothetical protein
MFETEELGCESFMEDLVRIKVHDNRWKDAPSTVVTKFFLCKYEALKNFEIYNDDVWMVCYPKTGSTWTQEMIWLLNNDLNFEKAKSLVLAKRFPYLE